jgi:NUMOD3 motif
MRKGSTMSAESRARISQALRGRPVSQETREKIGAKNRGHLVTEEMRQHLSEVVTTPRTKVRGFYASF